MPRSEISPVMAKFSLTGVPVASDRAAVTMVHPALGPSLGVAPYGTCKCTLWVARNSLSGSSPPK